MNPAQSSPSCLICNKPFEFVQAPDYAEDMTRTLLCTQHPPFPAMSVLSEVYAISDAYVRQVAEISANIRGQSIQAAWYTTQWFSLLLTLSSDDFILIYPIMRRAAIAYIPRALRGPNSPKGLLSLREKALTEVSGSCDQGMPKGGLRGVLAAIQLGLSIEKIDLDRDSLGTANSIVVITFSGHYVLRITGEGWLDLGYERQADDLSLRWFNGREPYL